MPAATAGASPRVTDADGVVYRLVTGAGPRFHPLLSFQALNAEVSAGRRLRARRLARALLARGRPAGRALVWPYSFMYAGHAPPWRSGMAQAVAAEALARAGYRRAARRAFLGLRTGLLARPGGRTWIRLYSFSTMPVLNAQLQAALSLRRYAKLTHDARAARLSRRLLASADDLFPRFETACWSRYALDGPEATPLYHRYVGELVHQVVAVAGTSAWRERAEHFYASQHRPVLVPGRSPGTMYPVPADRFRDRARFSFRLSKCAWVTLRVGSRESRGWYPPGRHAVLWRPGDTPGDYRVRLSAVDSAGRRAAIALPPLIVRRDQRPPRIAVSVQGPRLRWRARDAGTPWLRLSLSLRVGETQLIVPLGRREHRGSLLLHLPWRARAVLLAADSSGNTKRVPLGQLGLLGREGQAPLTALP